MISRLYMALFVSLLLFSSCKMIDSDALDQETIYQTYVLYYDDEENKTFATATFQVDDSEGNYVLLTGSSHVSFNGDTLLWQGITDGTPHVYLAEFPGFVGSGEFAWLNNDGQTIRAQAEMSPIDLPEDFGAIQLGETDKVTWEGMPIGPTEEVVLTLFITENRNVPILEAGVCHGGGYVTKEYVFSSKSLSETRQGATYVPIEEDELASFTLGQEVYVIERVARTRFFNESNQVNGQVISRYRSREH